MKCGGLRRLLHMNVNRDDALYLGNPMFSRRKKI